MIIKSLLVRIGADISEVDASLNRVGRSMKTAGAGFKNIGKTLSTRVSAPLIAMGAIALKVGADFEQAMMNAASVSGATADEMKEMEETARKMGATTVFSAKEAADAMYYMASAGWKAADMSKALKPTLDLAAATQSDLAFTTNTVVSALNQFGLTSNDAGRVSNVFAAAIANSQATMEKLSTSMAYAGPVMKSLGKGVEETGAALMVMYNAGLDASMAGTALKGIMGRLAEANASTTKAVEGCGIAMSDLNPETHSLAEIVKTLGESGATTGDIFSIFGQRAGPAMVSLIGAGADKLLEYQGTITGTAAAGKMAEMQINTLKGSFKLLTSALTEVAIKISKVLMPIVKGFIDKALIPLVEWIGSLPKGLKIAVIAIAALAAAVGPVLMVIGMLISMLPALITGLGILAGAFTLLTAGIAIVGVAIVAGIVLWTKYRNALNEVKKADERLVEAQKSLRQKLIDMKNEAGMTGEEFGKLTNKYKGNIVAMTMAIYKGKEGVELQEALAKVSKKHKEEIDKQKESYEAVIPKLEDYKVNLQEVPGIVSKMTEELNKATLSEYEYAKETLDKKKEDREEAIASEIEDETERVKALSLNEEIYRLAMEKLDKDHKEKEKKRYEDQNEAYLTAKDQLTDSIKQLTLSEHDYALWSLDSEYKAQVKHIEDTIKDEKKRNELLAALDKKHHLEKEAAQEEHLAKMTDLETVTYGTLTQLYGNFISDTLSAFEAWGEGSMSLLEGMGMAFKSLAKAAIAALKDIIAQEAISAVKTLIKEKAKAIAKVITSVMALPFPLNILAVGGAIAAVTLLFSKIKLFKEGGFVPQQTLAMLHPGEYVVNAPDVKALSKAGAGAGMSGGFIINQKNYFYGNISNVGDLDEISKRLAQRTRRAIERGRK